MSLWSGFEHKEAPETGRDIVQLTSGESTCYPLYYFIPSYTSDGDRLIYHRAGDGEVQLYMLDLRSGENVRLTDADSEETQWIPWCVDSGRGVLDHRSVLDVKGDRVIYFEEQDARCVNLDDFTDDLLFRLPDDRIAIGQNCMSPDGEWFVYIHHDRELFNQVYSEEQWARRSLSKGTVLAAFHMESGKQKRLVTINSPIHHVLPYGDDKVVFCHPATENGMLLTDLEGGWYSHLRTQDAHGGCVCHYVPTDRGLMYEVLGRDDDVVLTGVYDPQSHQNYEFPLPPQFGYTHTGRDPRGKMWVYENSSDDAHDLWFLAEHRPEGEDEWMRLTGDWPTYGGGQKVHFHPQITPDRQWILMTGGDPATESNHLCLVDISDLEDTRGF